MTDVMMLIARASGNVGSAAGRHASGSTIGAGDVGMVAGGGGILGRETMKADVAVMVMVVRASGDSGNAASRRTSGSTIGTGDVMMRADVVVMTVMGKGSGDFADARSPCARACHAERLPATGASPSARLCANGTGTSDCCPSDLNP